VHGSGIVQHVAFSSCWGLHKVQQCMGLDVTVIDKCGSCLLQAACVGVASHSVRPVQAVGACIKCSYTWLRYACTRNHLLSCSVSCRPWGEGADESILQDILVCLHT
jgi:hypothetical protein